MTPNQHIENIAGFVHAHLNDLAFNYPSISHNSFFRSHAMLLETVTGDRLFKQQLDRQINFFEALTKDYRITTLQIMDD